jgi:hypothetical protein
MGVFNVAIFLTVPDGVRISLQSLAVQRRLFDGVQIVAPALSGTHRHLAATIVHPSWLEMEDSHMFRIALYVGGMAAGFAAWLVWQDRKRATRRVPAKEAAEQLRAAWSDYHTHA